MNQLTTNEWYEALIDECGAIITQRVKNSREELMRGYHELGSRLLEETDNFGRAGVYGEEIVQQVAKSLSLSPRTIYNAIGFAKQFPSFEKVYQLDEGENISWTKVVKNYLPAKATEEKGAVIYFCPHCKQEVTKDDLIRHI